MPFFTPLLPDEAVMLWMLSPGYEMQETGMVWDSFMDRMPPNYPHCTASKPPLVPWRIPAATWTPSVFTNPPTTLPAVPAVSDFLGLRRVSLGWAEAEVISQLVLLLLLVRVSGLVGCLRSWRSCADRIPILRQTLNPESIRTDYPRKRLLHS